VTDETPADIPAARIAPIAPSVAADERIDLADQISCR
jgi:hypothetical protein